MEIVNLRKEKYDVYIGRGSKWGNPFIIGKDGTRDEVIEKYTEYILKKPELMNSLQELRGKRLGCYCSPLRCHGDVLKTLEQKQNEVTNMEKNNDWVMKNPCLNCIQVEECECWCKERIEYGKRLDKL